MVQGMALFFALFNNLAIFIALVAVYSYLLARIQWENWYSRQIVMGLSFGLFAIGCMHAKIPVFEGVIVDQRNAIVALSGAFGGALSALISAIITGAYRIYLGGDGAMGGAVGVSLSMIAGIGLNRFSNRFESVPRAAVSVFCATVLILPGFLFIGDIAKGWELTKAMMLPYGSAIYLGIFFGGLLLRREEERYRVEFLLRESESRYRTLFEYVPDGILIANQEGYCVDANPVICEMIGYSRDKLVRFHVSDIVAQHEVRNLETALDQIKAGTEYSGIWQLRRENGSAFTAEIMVTEMPDGNLLATIRDITQRKKMEAQLHQAQKVEAIGRLAGGIAHDLNNMLSPVLGYAELLLTEATDPDTRKNMLQQVINAGLKARGLVHQLLAFSRRQTLEYKPINLNATIEAFGGLLRRTIREDIDLVMNTSPDIRTVKADVGQIEQVIMNLCVNAQDAMPNGGKLILETALAELDSEYTERHPSSRSGQYAMLAVTDTGNGMDESTQKQIFDPFYSTKGELGTGLGLSTVYGIVKQHNGNIWVYSEPGKGTTFKVYLPTTDEQPVEIVDHEISTDKLKGSETILLVEDSEFVRNLACDILTRQGYRILSASNGAEVKEILAASDEKIDLLLTDVIIPDMNGKEIYEEVTKKHPNTKVLYMSGYTNNVIAHHGVLDEGVKFIQKPFTIRKLASKVRETIACDG